MKKQRKWGNASFRQKLEKPRSETVSAKSEVSAVSFTRKKKDHQQQNAFYKRRGGSKRIKRSRILGEKKTIRKTNPKYP